MILGPWKWDIRFLQVAELVSSWSKDPSTKCGAVITRHEWDFRTNKWVKAPYIVSTGYNGFPAGCDDHEDIYARRELKLARVVHAEQNAIIAAKQDLTNCTIYTWPSGIGPSCDRCSAHIIQAGITRVVHLYSEEGTFNERWAEANQRGLDMYKEACVQVVQIRKAEYERISRQGI